MICTCNIGKSVDNFILSVFFRQFFVGPGSISKMNLRNSHRGILTAHNSCFFFVSYLFGSAIKKSVRKMPPSPSWSYNCWFMILTKRYIFVHTPNTIGNFNLLCCICKCGIISNWYFQFSSHLKNCQEKKYLPICVDNFFLEFL